MLRRKPQVLIGRVVGLVKGAVVELMVLVGLVWISWLLVVVEARVMFRPDGWLVR